MSQYFRKYIKKQNYPVHFSQIKFKTSFNNCILSALERRQYKQTNDDDWTIYWCQKQFIPETLEKVRGLPNQKVNHFRNYYQICRKDLLIKNLKRFRKQLQKEGKTEQSNQYNFFPLTYNLPSEYPIFYEQFKKAKEKQKPVWIMKPIGKSQGKGIFLFKNVSQISAWSQMKDPAQPYIVQRYIADPLLLGGKKFDMRIYALCVSYQPLIVYLNRSGFARFTHSRYDLSDINNTEAHLTNVAIQKQSDNYDQERGGKWLLDKLRLFLISRYGEEKTNECFYNVQEIIINTLNSVTKIMINDKRCFQLYGFDILIDANLRPWLIEVNGSPSMTANTPVDFELKCGILDDVFTILDTQKLLTGQQEQIGGFDLIYKSKPVKMIVGKNNFSMLGCFNNRLQQLKKIAKAVTLRLTQNVPPQSKQQNKTSKNGKKVWGNNLSQKSDSAKVKVNNSVEPLKFVKVVKNKVETQVKFPEIRKVEESAKKKVINLDDNCRYNKVSK